MIRIRAFELATEALSLKDPYSKDVLKSLKKNLPLLHAEHHPKIRNDFLGLMKHVWTRLVCSVNTMDKNRAHYLKTWDSLNEMSSIESNDMEVELRQGSYDEHLAFVSWYISFLLEELQPTASYQRHITALSMLNVVLKEDVDSSILGVKLPVDGKTRVLSAWMLSQPLLRMVLDLAVNPFDDIRQLAASILELYLCRVEQDLSEPTISRATTLMRKTGRADHADGFGQLCDISELAVVRRADYFPRVNTVKQMVSELERGSRLAIANLPQAIESFPIHGYLIGLR